MSRYNLTFFILFSAFAFASPKHMELELDSSAYEKLFQTYRGDLQKHALSPVMDMGKRNLDWLKFINEHRDPAHKISFSSAASQPAYPIDAPRVSNPKIITDEFNTIKAEIPAWFTKILFEGGAFTENPPVSDADYIILGRRVDYSYQRASRWILQEPDLEEYKLEKANDVRGYYYLNLDPNHKAKLEHWTQLPAAEQKLFTQWLVGVCGNLVGGSNMEEVCTKKLNEDIQANNNPIQFYEKYFPAGKKKWNSFFDLTVKRPDVEWTNTAPNIMKAAFLDPVSAPHIKQFLIDNIEEEWRWGTWQLRLDFKTSGDFPKMEFVAGSTPHVNGLGGNTITMDENSPLTEYNVQWTIRHEYGHVLGFPDCYAEFYDKSVEAMISYQLDISNLMCSRRGHLKESHYQSLKKIYLD